MFASAPPDPGLGGLRFIEVFVPSLVVITLGTLGIQTLPIRLATYRERGILRRLSTTPAHPLRLLVAQLAVYLVTAVVALLLLIVVARLAFDVPLPRDPLGVPRHVHPSGCRPCSSSGCCWRRSRRLHAWRRPSRSRCSSPVMFLGGVYIPRAALGDTLMHIGEFTPPGVQGLQDAWMGTPPQLAPLAAMALITLVGGAVAARAFRWE